MKYVTQGKLAKWRKEFEPTHCPINGAKIQKPVVDHSHPKHNGTGLIRGVIDDSSNIILGSIENAYLKMPLKIRGEMCPEKLAQILENIAIYLRQPHTEYLHPVGATQKTKWFFRLKSTIQLASIEMLLTIHRNNGARKHIVRKSGDTANSMLRSRLYRKLITHDKYK